jgi:hypothetical protein
MKAMGFLLCEKEKAGEQPGQGMFPLRVEDAAAKQHLGESSHRDAVMPGLQTSFVSEDTYPIRSGSWVRFESA